MPVSFHRLMLERRPLKSTAPSSRNGVVIGSKRPDSSFVESRGFELFEWGFVKTRALYRRSKGSSKKLKISVGGQFEVG